MQRDRAVVADGWVAPAGGRGARVAVGIATKGRPAILRETLRELRRQTRAPDRIVVCHTAPQDVAGAEGEPGVAFLLGPVGSSRQRNAILDAVADCDVMLFFDDDFLAAPAYIEATLAVMEGAPDVAVTTGHLIADGSMGPGLGCSDARDLIAADRSGGAGPLLAPATHGYGCNMAVRLSLVRAHGIRFDERLALYGLYEDIDFSRQVGRHGRIVQVLGARGVHLSAGLGRTSGLRLGYSQVANAVYLWRKGSLSWDRALQRAGRHVGKNLLRALWPESHIDRRGRMTGNWLALADIARGRVRPERILDL
jgi:GT2 family glycosyltransferase